MADREGSATRAAMVVGVLLLSLWSGAEAEWQWSGPGRAGGSEAVAVLWAVALPLPLLILPRLPALAALGVVVLVLARALDGYRGPGSVAQSVILLVALFAAEATRSRPGFPVRSVGIGVALVGGITAINLADRGAYAELNATGYVHLLMLVAGGVGAGVALRDRREEAARLEDELRATDVGAAARMDALLAAERSRIAGEIDNVVALLLHQVRPLAERAARVAAPARLVRDMATVEQVAHAAMTEMRRALGLLRGPVGDIGARDVAAAVAATRRTRVRQAVGWVAPVALLAAIGLFEQSQGGSGPAVLPGPGHFFVPAPVLGPASPWVTAVVCVLPLLLRGRAPLLATAAVAGLLVVRMELHDLSALTFTHYYVAAAAAFLGAAHARSVAEGVAATAIGIATSLLCMELEQIPYEFFAFSFAAVLPAASGIGGLLVRDRVATAARARHAREELDRRHEEIARERVSNERLRAARELHDVVGHAVTVVGLQASVARRCAEVDLDRAREAARTVADVTAEAERDLTRLSAYLEVDGALAAAGSPSELVERMRAVGLPVTFRERTASDELPLALAQVAFRLVREALTNVGRHAGRAPTTVTIERRDGMLVVEVVNAMDGMADAPAVAPGRGIAGMRERAELYGGALLAGPDEHGRWRVRAELPLDVSEPAPLRAARPASP